MADARHDPEQQPLLSDHDPKRSTAGEFSHDSYVLQINEAEEWAQAYGNACYLAGLEAGRAATPSPPAPATPVATMPEGWVAIKKERLDAMLKLSENPSVPCYQGRGYYDEGKVHENWTACKARLDSIKEELQSATEWECDADDWTETIAAQPQPQPQPAQPLTGGQEEATRGCPMSTTPTLLALIDAYAEARHKSGDSTYNATTKAARDAVVAALTNSPGFEGIGTGAVEPVAEIANLDAAHRVKAIGDRCDALPMGTKLYAAGHDAWAVVAPAVEVNLGLYREVMAERGQGPNGDTNG